MGDVFRREPAAQSEYRFQGLARAHQVQAMVSRDARSPRKEISTGKRSGMSDLSIPVRTAAVGKLHL